MQENKNAELTVKFYYKEEGEAIEKILRDFVLLLIRREAEKLC